MKKLNFLFMVMLALTIGMFTSCTDDEDADPPTIVVTEQGTPTYAPGTSVTYHLVIAANEDLVDFWAEESTTGVPLSVIENVDPAEAFEEGQFVDFEKNLTKVELDYTYYIPTTVGANTEITIDFEVTDDKSEAVESVSFTVVDAVTRYTTVLLGSQASNTGSFYSTTTNQVIGYNDIEANKAIIDFVYYFGNSNKATIAAPADDDSQIVFSNLDASYNLTKFNVAPGIDAATFASMATVDALSALTFDVTKATELAADEIIAFETVAGKKGLFMVKTIDGQTYGESSEITIDVVVEN